MTIEGLGKKFQEARIERKLTLDEAARMTKIRPSRLAEIEADDFSQFPSLTYAKGFLQIYGKFLDVDVSPYMEAFEGSDAVTVDGYSYLAGQPGARNRRARRWLRAGQRRACARLRQTHFTHAAVHRHRDHLSRDDGHEIVSQSAADRPLRTEVAVRPRRVRHTRSRHLRRRRFNRRSRRRPWSRPRRPRLREPRHLLRPTATPDGDFGRRRCGCLCSAGPAPT